MQAKEIIRVLIGDSNAIYRQGLYTILDAEPGLCVIAQAASAQEAIAAYEQHRPDVAILDLRMPELECLHAIKAIRLLNANARILILTYFDGGEDIVRGMRAGASGYLLKEASPAEVIEAIRMVYTGKKRITPEIAAKLAEHALAEELSDAERRVLERMAQGKSNLQIAEALSLSESTVKFHVNNILLKLDAANRTEAVLTGLKRGLVRLGT